MKCYITVIILLCCLHYHYFNCFFFFLSNFIQNPIIKHVPSNFFFFFSCQKRVEVLYNVRSYSKCGFIRLGRKGQGLSLNFLFNWLVTLPHRFARVAGRAWYRDNKTMIDFGIKYLPNFEHVYLMNASKEGWRFYRRTACDRMTNKTGTNLTVYIYIYKYATRYATRKTN